MLHALLYITRPPEPELVGRFQGGIYSDTKPITRRKIRHVLAECFSWRIVRNIRDTSNVATDQAEILVECACADLKTASDELPRLKGNGLWEGINASNEPSHGVQTN